MNEWMNVVKTCHAFSRSLESYCNCKVEISTVPTKAKLWDPAYWQAFNIEQNWLVEGQNPESQADSQTAVVDGV